MNLLCAVRSHVNIIMQLSHFNCHLCVMILSALSIKMNSV